MIAHGALAAEALLLEEVTRWVERAQLDPTVLGRGLRVLVPSRSLREHVSAMLVRRVRAGLAGVKVQTLHALALELLQRADRKPPRGEALVRILIRRHAAQEPFLQQELGHLEDGMGAVVGTVVDFLEAGLETAHLEALEEMLSSRVGSREAQRALAILRVAGRIRLDMECHSVGILSTCLQEARKCLEEMGGRLTGGGPILVHGFAEATGVATDFLEALLRTQQCTVVLDHPPRPGHWSQPDPSCAFTQRLLTRLSTNAEIFEDKRPGFRPQSVTVFSAPGAQAECREVAASIQTLLRSGLIPEQIGVVARTLEPYITALRTQFNTLGIPFSTISTPGPLDPAGRASRGLLELMRRGESCPTELWLELLNGSLLRDSTIEKQELMLAQRCLGTSRLRDLAHLDLGHVPPQWRDGYPLPLRLGLEETDPGRISSPRTKVPLEVIHRMRQLAVSIQSTMCSWAQSRMDIREHLRLLEELSREHLGWDQDHSAMSLLQRASEQMRREIPQGIPLTLEEFLLALEEVLKQHGRVPVGGQGGGVQVLEVMDARARTFEHLFLMGMNRDFFPRPIRPDPLLPDSLRRLLSSLLPDMPIKETGFLEERYLFAQLLSSSHHVTLSFQSTDEEGRPKGESPLLEGILLELGITEKGPSRLFNRHLRPLEPPRQLAIRLGLEGRRESFQDAMRVCLESFWHPGMKWDPKEVARARRSVLEEVDPDLRTPQGRLIASSPGPYMGFIGPIQTDTDPRKMDLYVTTLENMASCPWQTFLKHILRLEPSQDPLGAIPEATLLELGSLVHAVLERLVSSILGDGVGGSLELALGRIPIEIPWPEEDELRMILQREAERLLVEQGLRLAGLSRVLCGRAMPYLMVAKEVDWAQRASPPRVLTVEVEGGLEVVDGQEKTTVRFRADRADLTPEGLLLTDYKVGKSISEAVKEETRTRKFLEQVASGQRLQAVAYAVAASSQVPVTGRYLFLDPDTEPQGRIFRVQGHQVRFKETLYEVLRSLLRAWRKGVFFPRLVTPDGKKEPTRCEHCEVSTACFRGDSGIRTRLLRWAESAMDRFQEEDQHSSFASLWMLPEAARENRTGPRNEP